MKILVTGGNGFIGSHLVALLRAKGHETLVFDRAWMEEPVFLGDVRDRTAVSEAVYKTDAVIHLAAILGTQETVDNPSPAAETNILGALNVFAACREHNRPGVYITVGNRWMNNPYAITKDCSRRFAMMYNREHGTRIAIVRALNVYGPGQSSWPIRKIIPTFIMAALQDRPLEVYGDGEQRMDMIYIDDAVEILARALLVDHGKYDSVFEAGTGIVPTVNEIACAVIAACDSSSPIVYLPMRPGEPPNSTVAGDPSTLAPLRFNSFVPFNIGLARTVEWYRANGDNNIRSGL